MGVSIGIERIFAILEAEADRKKTLVRTTETEVYVATAHKKLHEDRMRIIAQLWDAGIRFCPPPALLSIVVYTTSVTEAAMAANGEGGGEIQ